LMQSCGDSEPQQCGSYVEKTIAIPTVIHGLVSLGIGAPLAAIGNKRGPRQAAGAPEVRVGPTGGGMRWSF